MPKDLQSLVAFQEETDYFNILFFQSVRSTNDTAHQLAEEGYTHGTVVVADAQQRGKGRLGRSWFSPPGVNIYMSILLRPVAISFHPTLVTLSASLAVVKAIEKLEIRNTNYIEVWPKWPNDIYCGNKKLGGILTESYIKRDEIAFLVIGIGINVNMKREEIPEDFRKKTTSLYNETGSIIERDTLIVSILRSFLNYYELLFSNPSSIVALWSSISQTINSYVKAFTHEGNIYGKAVGLDGRGFLRLVKDTGEEIIVSSADIVHLR